MQWSDVALGSEPRLICVAETGGDPYSNLGGQSRSPFCVRQLAMQLSPRGLRTKSARIPLVLAILTGVVWQNFGQDALFTPSHVVSIALAIGVPVTYLFMGKQRGTAVTDLQRGTILLSIAALPMLFANGLYLSYGSADGAAGDIGGILIMLLGWAALVGTSAFLIDSPSSAQKSEAAR